MAIPRYAQHANSDTYHMFGRGVEKRPIFIDEADYLRFQNLLDRCLGTQCTVLVSCLMPNHFHLMVIGDMRLLSQAMHKLLTSYAMYFNIKYQRVGHLFQGRFQSKPVESDAYFQQLLKYIMANPPQPDYRWLFVSRTVLDNAKELLPG